MLSISNNVTLHKNNSQFLKTPNSASAIFDGQNDYIDASTLGSSINKESGTISHWAKITTSANNEVLFSCSAGDSGENKIQTVFMTATSSGQFQAVYKSGGAAKKAVYNFPAADIVGAGWFHLAMTYSKVETSITIKLYFNGALQNTFTGEVDTIGEEIVFDRVILGKNANANNSYLTGSIDEYAYYTRVLTADEILRIYNAKGTFDYIAQADIDVAPESLKQWLRFGDGANNFASDQTTGIIDMSDNSLGSELVTNGDFAQGNNSWTFNSSYWNISDGTANALGVANGSFTQTLAVSSGKIYKIEIKSTITSGNGIYAVKLGTTQKIFDNGTSDIALLLLASGNNVTVSIQPGNSAFSVSRVSVQEVNGNPAFTSGALINQDDNPTA